MRERELSFEFVLALARVIHVLALSPGKRKKSKAAAMPAAFNPQSDLVKQIRTTLKLTEVRVVCAFVRLSVRVLNVVRFVDPIRRSKSRAATKYSNSPRSIAKTRMRASSFVSRCERTVLRVFC